MKTMPYFFLLLILSSCFSFKQISNDEPKPTFDSGKKYTLTLTSKTKITVKNLRIEGENYYYIYRNREKSVPISGVKNVAVKNFSWIKTGGLVIGVVAVAFGAVAISLSNLKIGFGEMSFK